jgi:hypothetical protein
MRTTSEAKADRKAAPPIHKERLAFVEAAVWENEVGTEGKTRLHVTLSKSYKDAVGNWQRTGNLDVEDLPYAVKLLDRCHTWAAEQRYARAKVTTQEDQQEENEEQEHGR